MPRCSPLVTFALHSIGPEVYFHFWICLPTLKTFKGSHKNLNFWTLLRVSLCWVHISTLGGMWHSLWASHMLSSPSGSWLSHMLFLVKQWLPFVLSLMLLFLRVKLKMVEYLVSIFQSKVGKCKECFIKNGRHIFVAMKSIPIENAQAKDAYCNTTWMTSLKYTCSPSFLTVPTFLFQPQWRPLWSCFLHFLNFISDQAKWQECPGLDNIVSSVLYSRLALQFSLEEAGSSEMLYLYYISFHFWTIYIPETTYSLLKVDPKTELFLLVSEW